MPRRPYIRMESLQQRWQRSPFTGGLLGILSVALATAAIAALCALIALVVALVY
ncbi:MAG TPA: hypothetical protein VK891_06160 [Euzebyales bacterium]|nr:hypothetical protein [Euzebyales bacterium]